MNYYNEIDPYAAQWLMNLIEKGLIPDGEVDTRSIVDVRPSDLAGFTQCHFFAGIGGWSLALKLAGWPEDRPIWTGSCPCQPFSVAGKGLGTKDPRHLWPDFYRLIAAARPPVVMGEQVAGAAGYGWFDGITADLARKGYACRGVDIPACAVDAPHIRQRLYWVASDMADAESFGHCEYERNTGTMGQASTGDEGEKSSTWRAAQAARDYDKRVSFWSNHIWLTGADGKARRAEPTIPLLAHGIPGRVGRLRAYGNAIVPPLAAEVIKAFMEADKCNVLEGKDE